MNIYRKRAGLDKSFTVITSAVTLGLIAVLILVLGPMAFKGASAVFFTSTVEYRKMQYDLYQRGDRERLQREIAESKIYRDFVYDKIDEFKEGIDTSALADKAKQIYRAFGDELEYKGIDSAEIYRRQKFARRIRRQLKKAFNSTDKSEIVQILDGLNAYKKDDRITGTGAMEFFSLAQKYRRIIRDFDLSKRPQYSQQLEELSGLIRKLLGPRADEPAPPVIMERYGATRGDMAEKLLEKILYKEKWTQLQPNQPMVKVKTARAADFAGTKIEPVFDYIEKNFDRMMKFEPTVYWQYFIDDSTSGHYFGGIGPEILGTLILTFLSMIFVFPLGVISAAYLTECASDNFATRIIRMSINTLAGVPSIVFGLFGLAFFVLFLFPAAGLESKPSILAASLTLSVLTLPVMIRASEEAIRSVPQTYKEASLGLGAGRFATFVRVTLPAALPGILTGVILSLSRVAGETAPILFTGACAFGSVPDSIFDQTRTLSYGSYDIAVGDRIGMLVPHKQYGMVVTLVLLIILLNTAAVIFRAKIFKKLKGL